MSALGSLVLTSPLFSHVISDSVHNAVCDHCLDRPHLMDDDPDSSSIRLERCSGCHLVHYCQRACQRAAWPKHKSECKYLKAISPRRPPSIVRLIARTIQEVHSRPDYGEVLPDKRRRRFIDLMSHKNEISTDQDKIEAFRSFVEVLVACVGREAYSAEELFYVYCRILVNSVEITDDFGNSIGTGIYLGLSAIDHSCKPNVSVTFVGRTVKLRAMENIPEPVFQNIRINYLNEILPGDERRRRLQDQYYFQCSCEMCEDKDIDQVKSGSLICLKCSKAFPVNAKKCKACMNYVGEDHRKRYHEVMEASRKNSSNGEADSLDSAKHILHNYQLMVHVVHPMDWRMVEAAEQAMSAALVINDMIRFFEIGKSLLEPYETYYPEYSVSTGLHLMKLGKAAMYNDDLSEGNKILQKAAKLVRVSHGEDHRLYKYLVNLLRLPSH